MVIIITGPTASGKSWLAEQLADRHNGAIINADMGQFYTACTIGTAKPAWRKQQHPSYLFDWVDAPRDVTVKAFKQAVDNAILTAQSAGKLPIIVGGSAFYIKSLFYPPQEIPLIHEAQPISADTPTSELWQQLNAIDPVRAAELYVNDRYRIERALSIWQTTGVLPSLCKPTFIAPYKKITTVFLLPDREILEKRIRSRTNEMIHHQGWIEEARQLLNTDWEDFIVKKGFVGYQELFTWLRAGENQKTLPEVISLIGTKTRQYARRQEIFLKKLSTDLDRQASADFTFITENEVSFQVVNKIESACNLTK